MSRTNLKPSRSNIFLCIFGFLIGFTGSQLYRTAYPPIRVGSIVSFEASALENGQLATSGFVYNLEGKWIHVHPIVNGHTFDNEHWKLTRCEVESVR